MKFRSDTKIFINNNDNKLSITTEPILDRANRCWVKYDIIIDNDDNEIKNILNESNEILYGKFKRLFSINYVIKLDCERKMTREDYMSDLDFMKGEILKCKNAIIKYRSSGREDLVIRYQNLIENEQYKMFQVNTKEEFESYLDYIESLIVQNEKNIMEQLSTNIMTIWDD